MPSLPSSGRSSLAASKTDAFYVCVSDYSAIRKKIAYRPGRGFNSVEPRIYGLQTAIVVGPAGQEIHTDEYGRVRVQFHWVCPAIPRQPA